MDKNIRICGEAGQGLQSMGVLLSRTFASMGAYVFASQTYLSRVRGGVNTFDIRLSDRFVHAPLDHADILVALNRKSMETCLEKAGASAIVILNSAGTGEGNIINIDLEKAAGDAGGTARMANAVAAGAALALLNCESATISGVISEMFSKKGADVAEQNIACAKKGAELCEPRRGAAGECPRGEGAPKNIFSGSEAVGLSAALSGVKVVSAYPMTPATDVFEFLAAVSDKYRIVVEQAEDEIAALNMVCGAVYAGVPAMTCTSGGGFSLMVEALSLSGIMELPVVIFLGQRPGPATGLPTRTEQADLKFAIHAGHGEFPRALFAPGTVEQAFHLTRRALETAHIHQSPVFIMSDHFLSDASMNTDLSAGEYNPVDRHIVTNPGADYVRYEITDSGISPRAIPGANVIVVADSHEHSPDGHITEEPEIRVKMQDKRMRKMNGLVAAALDPEVYPLPAGEVLLCWGSAYGPCREAVDILRAQGRDVCMAHFPQVWPVNREKAAAVLSGRKVTAVEGNSTAQFAYMLRAEGALEKYETILRYDGFAFSADYIVRRYDIERNA